MASASPLSDTQEVLQVLERATNRALRAASGLDVDAHQVVVARLADLATEVRAARDLADYALQAKGIFEEHAAVFSGSVASALIRLAHDHGTEHGLDESDLAAEPLRTFVRQAVAEDRVRAIGRRVAGEKGRNDAPLDELLDLTRQSVREFAEAEIAPHAERIHRRWARERLRGAYREEGFKGNLRTVNRHRGSIGQRLHRRPEELLPLSQFAILQRLKAHRVRPPGRRLPFCDARPIHDPVKLLPGVPGSRSIIVKYARHIEKQPRGANPLQGRRGLIPKASLPTPQYTDRVHPQLACDTLTFLPHPTERDQTEGAQ